ncbi:MAG TPA: hypothetical protein VFU21_27140 [Kofleriaceae bacterium]|nr:hypothetical protein [Kofleriaceae bacterium]
MAQRNKSTTNGRKLAIQKETLRKLQVRTLDDEQLKVVAGGKGATQCGCAPSHMGQC